MKIKYGKAAVVIFITVLIWVWADLALDVKLSVYSANITVVTSNPKRWVSFDEQASAPVEEIVLKGPAARIAEVKKQLKKHALGFEFDPAEEKMDESGEHSLILLPFLQKATEIKELGVKVESCKPDKIPVTVVELVERTLDIKCVDEDANPVTADIDPPQVRMFVQPDWEGERLTATVLLTLREIDYARVSPISKKPYVKLADQIREAKTPVTIATPQIEDPRQDYSITATLSIAMSPVLLGNYKVEITNREEVYSAIAIRATPGAKRAYEAQEYPPMTLYILDDDIKKGTDELRRNVVYNFPEEFVSKGEIGLKNPQQPARARFKLVPLTSAETASGGIE
jgi:hypothetical protein